MARRGQVRRIDKITPFKSGTKLSALCVYFIYIADLIGLEFQPCGQECFNIKSVLVIRVGSVLEIGVLGDVVLIRKERTHTTQLEDTLASIHNSKLILAHQLFATMSSDELKKVATIKEFLFVATILIIFQPVSYCLTCIIREYEL